MESVMLSIIALAVIATGAWLGRLGIQTWHERELALIEMGAGVEGEQTTTAWARAKNSGSQSKRQQTA